MLAGAGAMGCGGCAGQRSYRGPAGNVVRYRATGEASWYGDPFTGRTTACGEVFDPTQLTAAHQTLPCHTMVRVVAVETGRSVVVRINDHFPGTRGRIIDLSQAAFAAISPLERGVLPVRLEVLGPARGG